ncbi:hypothetical protein M2310_004071 [Rhizobium leguminosarum]|uniref:Uncharacterized protein n=1 Tax=Rhizobium esperanzae TaxID=1967781 RepID=A0A7W6XWL4_9HYPH|nr:hypothetical protein [Rhizobium esperanzae]MDH6203390.1 hypothetical protein [Rhizobium leguminosarum]
MQGFHRQFPGIPRYSRLVPCDLAGYAKSLAETTYGACIAFTPFTWFSGKTTII